MNTSYAVFCGIDVGKGEHHAVGLDASGTRLFDKALPNDETRLRAVLDGLAASGPLLGDRRSTEHHRRAAGHRGPGLRARRRVPARAVDAPNR